MAAATAETPQQQHPGETHQQAQESLAGLIPALLATAWPLLDISDLAGSIPKLKAAVLAIVTHYGRASASLALQHYRDQRYAAGVHTGVQLPMPPAPSTAEVSSAVDWALSGLWGPPSPEAEQAAKTNLEVAADRLVVEQGRQAVLDAVRHDPQAKGWARIPDAGACAFCLMLAARGAVYKTESAASFQVHDNCHCTPEAWWRGHYEPTARVRAAQALWRDSTKGRSGNDARVAFRQAVEGRPVTGTTGPKHESLEPIVGLGLTRSQVEHQLETVRALKPSAWRTKRLAELEQLLVHH